MFTDQCLFGTNTCRRWLRTRKSCACVEHTHTRTHTHTHTHTHTLTQAVAQNQDELAREALKRRKELQKTAGEDRGVLQEWSCWCRLVQVCGVASSCVFSK